MEFLNTYAWIGALLFARLAAVLMVAPGWGEQAAPPTLRLGLAVLVTATLAPSLIGAAPRELHAEREMWHRSHADDGRWRPWWLMARMRRRIFSWLALAFAGPYDATVTVNEHLV